MRLAVSHQERLSEQQFDRFRDFIYRQSGIRVDASKTTLVSNRIRRRLRAGDFPDFDTYYKHLTSSRGAGELEHFLDAITTNETHFFRTEAHFDWFRGEFLSEVISRQRQAEREPKLRIWSAACSTGEEPYSLAICLAENSLRLRGWETLIVGTEILLSAECSPAELRAAADVDGVELIEIDEGATAFAEADVAATAEAQLETRAASPPLSPSIAREAEDEAVQPSAGGLMPASAAAEMHGAKPQTGETVRVDLARLDTLMNLVGELVVNKARFVQIARQMSPVFRQSRLSGRARVFGESLRRAIQLMKSEAGNGAAESSANWSERFGDLESEIAALEDQSKLWEEGRRGFAQITEAIDQMARVSGNLQRGVLDTRMVPIAPLFNRFKRVVRDIALELGKKVHLETRGEKTELDKRMIDELGDPLVHLVRNAIDHGIEPSDVRVRRGKPEAGTICLEASHSGNNVFISVRDDGGGVDIEKVRHRIIERKMLPEDAAAALSDREVLEYIWHPGFSTADAVSDISGRGVGMDIVKTRIAALNGTIDVEHAAGRGTTFTVRLPLTLAIIRSLLFRVRCGTFAVPIDSVREIVSVPLDQIVTVHGRQTIDVRGRFIPLVSIDEIFDWHKVNDQLLKDGASGTAARRTNVLVLHSANKTIGLRVDDLDGAQEIVIKSLAENFVHIRGLSGASILGDGSVCLLLDAAAMIDMVVEARGRSSQADSPLRAGALVT